MGFLTRRVWCASFVMLVTLGMFAGGGRTAAAPAGTQEQSRDAPVTAAPVVATQTGPGEITVTWKAVPGATGYTIGRAVWPNGYQRFRPNYPAETRLVDRDIKVGVLHTYRVAALLPNGRASAPATSKSLTPVKDAPVVEAPAAPETPKPAPAPAAPPAAPNGKENPGTGNSGGAGTTGSRETGPAPAAGGTTAPGSPKQTGGPSPVGSGAVGPPPGVGTIAYVRGHKEIRVISPSGTGDRRLWTHADAKDTFGINQLAWRPDGKELAFSSGHDSLFSRYHADIYAIKPDGRGFRKLTNTPERSAFKRYKQGVVTVVVRNEQPSFSRGMANVGIFTIYIAGAKKPQIALIPPRGSKTLVFPAVADFGDAAQPIVAIYGSQRWVSPGTDVKGGARIKAPDLIITGDGVDLFGAFRPVWRRDASRISYRSGLGIISSIAANPPVGRFSSKPFFSGENPSGSFAWDWGPTPELANQAVYITNAAAETGIFRMTEGGAHPGTKLPVELGEYPYLQDVRWLPDGSGIVFSKVDMAAESSNLYRYDFATRRTTALTQLTDFAHAFSISPDGRWVVFERTKTRRDDKTADLWLVGTDGSGLRRLVSDGYHPAWGRP